MKKANKIAIGAFVVGAVGLLILGIVVFGSGALFKKSDKYTLYFDRSVKGLSVGAPVIFKGVKLGNVHKISLVYDQESKDELIEVVIDVELALVRGLPEPLGYPDYKRFIEHGLRAKLDMQNFVTGQLMVSFGLYPDTPAKLHNLKSKYPELPVLPTQPDIFEVMDEIPIKEISQNLNQIVSSLNKIISSQGLAELDIAIREIIATARAMRLLAEYLETHPEAFLRGKPGSVSSSAPMVDYHQKR